MSRCALLRAAEDDLLGIWLSIAQDDQGAATRVLQSISEKFQLITDNNKIGPARPDIAAGLRYFVAGSYLILYREVQAGVEIVRVLHGARNLRVILQEDTRL